MLGTRAFKSRAHRAHVVEGWVADAFEHDGLDVDRPERNVRDDYAEVEAGDYENEADLFVCGHRIEVRERVGPRYAFTRQPRSYPFAWCDVDEPRVYDKKTPPPLAYVFYSERTGAMLTMRADRPQLFSLACCYTEPEDRWRWFYTMRRRHVRTFAALVRYLRGNPA